MDLNHLKQIFSEKFTTKPRLFRAPGRINLIGEHTDYNEGFVLPAAVNKEIWMLMAPNGTDAFKLYSKDMDESVEFDLSNYATVSEQWARYPIGVLDQLMKSGSKIPGVDCVFSGDIPLGAGMSSSAALESATVFAFNELFQLGLTKKEMALLAQKAENEFVGVNCGIMDQYASVCSEQDYFLKIDCRDLSFKKFKVDLGAYDLVLINSMVKHSLVSTAYNQRRKECESVIRKLNANNQRVHSLRDVTLEQLASNRELFSLSEYNRAKYVISEITRVEQACDVIVQNDIPALGQLLYETHEGLKSDYEVSCEEMDYLVNLTKDYPDIVGARMMGGGFGGCTLNLIHNSCQSTIEKLCGSYEKKFGICPEVYHLKTVDGASEWKDFI